MSETLKKSPYKYQNNVVTQDAMRKVQGSVLENLSDILRNSFGPHGSNTCIKKMDALNMYTKDGYTILKNVYFNGIIEQAIKDDIESITQNVATTVGDGTTSAVLLADYIFSGLVEYLEANTDTTPAEVLFALNSCCDSIKKQIKASATEPNLDKIYQIALVSANGNKWIANTILDIYKQFGLGVFIDVSPSLENETSIKYFDGMTLNTGFNDSSFVTDSRNNSSTVDKPELFFFEDPIDNKEMGVLFDSILSQCIVTPILNNEPTAIVPVVIICPHLSRDITSNIDRVMDWQRAQPVNNKLPFLLITDVHQVTTFQDIAAMCGAKPIRKYIDKELYEKDVEKGLAPTPYNVREWAGKCDQVVATSARTKFINPSKMKNPDGTFTNEYNNLLEYVNAEITRATEEGDSTHKGTMKRRLHALQTNLVEISVGGISIADRDSNRHLFEDAVLNCRSAANNGVGWGANFNGLMAARSLAACTPEDSEEGMLKYDIMKIIATAYEDIIIDLYTTCGKGYNDAVAEFKKSIEKGMPINLRTMEYDGNVLSSIESDQIVLNSVATIVGIMVTCNQFLVPSPQHNVYMPLKEINIDEKEEG